MSNLQAIIEAAFEKRAEITPKTVDAETRTAIEEVIEAAEQLRSHGIENVIISMGEKGSVWLNSEGVLQAQPPRCENVVSTVGAGDSMVAGLIYGFSQGWSKEKTLSFASATSALAVSQSNVGISDKQVLEQILAQVKLTNLSTF